MMDRYRLTGLVSLCLGMALVGLLLGGCAQQPRRRTHGNPPPYAGPAFMRNSIDSYVVIGNGKPMLVSGYGLVVNLSGTGSNIIAPGLRRHMQLEVARHGLTGNILDDRNTAAVAVEGLIPPGARRGSRFDLLVSSLPQTQVTSLAGGRLWRTSLSMMGTDLSMDNRTLASARGPLYVNPFENEQAQERHARQAVIIGGGVVTGDRFIELILRQPHYNRARAIADRINERFPRMTPRYPDDPLADKHDAANPVSDALIEIKIPMRYSNRSAYFINLMRHLYLDHGYNFEYEKAHQLAKVLRASPHRATDVVLAWEALGRYANSALVDYYEDKNRLIQLYALEAGAALGDERTTKVLQRLAKHDDRTIRRRVAAILGSLNRSVRGPRILHDLVSDDDLQVRLLAYESLVRIGDPIIQRTQFAGAGGFKFVLDLVPSQKPLIYIAQSPVPRIVIFDMMLGFAGEPIMSLWNDRLMLRPDGHDTLKVFYQKPGQVEARQIDIRPTVANLVYLMGHHPTVDHPMPGLDLQFTQVAQVLHRLTKQGRIASPIQLQVNPGALTLAKQRQNPPLQPGSARPDIGQAIDMP